jgi:opacity protein-like surface antigen
MKKLLFTVIVIVVALGSAQAQVEPVFVKGDKVVNLGIGLGTYYGGYFRSVIPPLAASVEYGMKDNLFDVENLNFGLGGYVGFYSSRYRYLDYGYTTIVLGVRGSLHYPFVEKLDTYAGLLLGPRINIATGAYSGTYVSAPGSPLAFDTYVGGRYYFSEKMAVFGELGYGIAYLTLGVALKL